MAKREEVAMDVVYARCLKQECEEGLAKVDEGIRWGLYALLAFIANMVVSAMATVVGGILGNILGVISLVPMLAQFVCTIMAIVKGGGLGKVVRMMGRIAKWAYYLVPFIFADIIIALWVLLMGIMMFFVFPVVFYALMKRSYKKDWAIADEFIRMYEAELARFNNNNNMANNGMYIDAEQYASNRYTTRL